MQVYFWGTRGSLPTSITYDTVADKIKKAITKSLGCDLGSEHKINAFIDELPFSIRGCYGGNTSCVEIRGPDEFVICDAGSGIRNFGNHVLQLNNPSKIFHIFISHLHWDHIHGFPFFVPAYIPGNRVNIYGFHPDLEYVFIKQQESPGFPVPFESMQADISFQVLDLSKDYEIAGLNVKGIQQNHPGDSFGYCFSKDGKKLVYSTDSEHKSEVYKDDYHFIDFFKDADILIYDAQYKLGETLSTKENWGHSNNLVGVELADRAGVKKVCFFHNEPAADDETLDKFLHDTRRYLTMSNKNSSMEIYVAHDGLILDFDR